MHPIASDNTKYLEEWDEYQRKRDELEAQLESKIKRAQRAFFGLVLALVALIFFGARAFAQTDYIGDTIGVIMLINRAPDNGEWAGVELQEPFIVPYPTFHPAIGAGLGRTIIAVKSPMSGSKGVSK